MIWLNRNFPRESARIFFFLIFMFLAGLLLIVHKLYFGTGDEQNQVTVLTVKEYKQDENLTRYLWEGMDNLFSGCQRINYFALA